MRLLSTYLSQKYSLVILTAALVGWIVWLRGPSLDVPIWNVDETIHATVAEVLLDGGTLYKDAIDQRTPLTYYFTAAVFAVSGSSLEALRAIILIMIAAGALALGLIARRLHGIFTGLGAALVFAAFSNYLLFPADTFAAHTEWFVTFFTIGAAYCFFSGKNSIPSNRRCCATGVMLGLAVMSKQSALLDIAPPIVALVFLVIDGRIKTQAMLSRFGAISGGVLAAGIVVSTPVFLGGAAKDFLYYGWTYNLNIYGSEFTFFEKVGSGLHLIENLAEKYPLLLASGTIGLIWLFARCAQFRPKESARVQRFAEVYLTTWLITSVGAAMAGGRGFDHYFFPVLPPLSWICVIAPGIGLRHLETAKSSRKFAHGITLVLFGFLLATAIFPSLKARSTPAPVRDPAIPVSDWIKKHSAKEDRIFVWGFNPDIYRYTDRLPASRFLYCSFQTGLIPWTNTDPDVNTEYAVVDGAMEVLLSDLIQIQPKFVIDSSAGPHRFFGKYPPKKFPAFESWLQQNYAELEPKRWGRQGFRLYIRADARIENFTSITTNETSRNLSVIGTDRLTPGINKIGVSFSTSAENSFTGLGVALNEKVVAASTFSPLNNTSIQIHLTVSSEMESVQVTPLVQLENQTWIKGLPVELPVVEVSTSPDQRNEFAIPLLTDSVRATGIRTSYGAQAEDKGGVRTFSMHAPAVLTYEIPAGVTRVRGNYGLPEAAYATDNPSPSDGAEFIVRHQPVEGDPVELLRHHIEPLKKIEDTSTQSFIIDIPPTRLGDVIEFEITSGPEGNASSDWTYWADLILLSSP